VPINHIHLRAFHEVAATGSFTVAARNLHVSQPTLSEQVKTLERTYRASLFSRRGRSVALTPLGDELLGITTRMAALDLEAERCLHSARDLTRGRLRLGTDAPIHAMPVLAEFTSRHPDVDLSLVTGNAAEVLADVLEHRVDAAMVSDPPDDARLATLRLLEDRFVAYVHRDDPLAARKRVRLADLVARRLVLREIGSQTRRVLDRALADANLTMREVIEVDSREASQTAVAMQLGVGIGVESELSRDPRLVVVPIAGAALRTSESLVCLAERRTTNLITAVFDAAADSLPLPPSRASR
jgi:aminoethylphosphonate catabolism LysR family transcriptional regulator